VTRTLDVLPADFRSHFSKVMHVPVSQHGLGRFEGEVWADQAAFDAGTATLIVEEHKERATGKYGPLYVMKREGDGWQWYAQDQTGVVLDDKTNASVRALCADCHANAPKDGTFRK
jgi:hypothetical protein